MIYPLSGSNAAAASLLLKDGSQCSLRSPRAADAHEILRHMRLTSEESPFMLRYSDEISMGESEEANYLEMIARSADALMVSAFVGGDLAANAGFNPVAGADKCRHRAELGISIKSAYRSLGIGSAIMASLIECARAAGYELLELSVVEENVRALALYDKLGFERCGRIERVFKLRSGGYQSLLLMQRAL